MLQKETQLNQEYLFSTEAKRSKNEEIEYKNFVFTQNEDSGLLN